MWTVLFVFLSLAVLGVFVFGAIKIISAPDTRRTDAVTGFTWWKVILSKSKLLIAVLVGLIFGQLLRSGSPNTPPSPTTIATSTPPSQGVNGSIWNLLVATGIVLALALVIGLLFLAMVRSSRKNTDHDKPDEPEPEKAKAKPKKSEEEEKKEKTAINATLGIPLSLLLLLVLAGLWIYLFQNRFWRVTVVSHLNEISVLFVSLLVLAALSIPKATRGLADFVLVVGGAVIFCAAVVAGCNLTVDFFSKPSEPTKQAEGERYKLSPTNPVVTVIAPPYNDPDKPGARWSEVVDTDVYGSNIYAEKCVWQTRSDSLDVTRREKPVLAGPQIPTIIPTKHKRYCYFMSAGAEEVRVIVEKN